MWTLKIADEASRGHAPGKSLGFFATGDLIAERVCGTIRYKIRSRMNFNPVPSHFLE